ncbi:hypothetical protein HU200_029555 [Digitaria exilis]|uniref:BHLH domain-containing protein n=1 Tax=Digitaria exilis TaxID=1010633 RepID=A0A835BY96_9POAL|nr:hypothetical protein HU200_029555 [Digitaria exilis]
MVKEEEIIAEAGRRGYKDLLGGGEEDYLVCLSPSSYFSSSVVSTTTTGAAAPAAAPSPTCVSYLDLAPAYHHMLSFAGQEQYHGGDGVFGFQYYGGDQAIPVTIPQKSSPTAECSSSISSMSSSPPATTISAISSSKPQAFKQKGSRSSYQRKAAPAAVAATAASTNKRPRVRREKLGERIIALQQLVSPFGKSDTASVLHEALGYIRFLHDQVQVLSSPYMQRLPASAHAPLCSYPAASSQAPESAAGTVVEPPRPSDLRSRGLCLVPVSCMEHVAASGHAHGNGADLWSARAAGMAKAAEEGKGPAGALPGGHSGHLA